MSKKLVWILCIILLVSLVSSASHQTPNKPQINTKPQLSTPKMDINYGKIPLYFIPNEGQVDDTALFYADTSKYTLWITQEGLIFDSLRTLEEPKQLKRPTQFGRDVSRLKFLDANPHAMVIPEKRSDYKVSYFRGKDSSNWQTGIGTSRAVLYRSLYTQIDLRVYGVEQEIEYDFIVKPGGEVGDIRFEYQHVLGTKLDEQGNLIIQTPFGELTHTRPVAYQIIQNNRVEVMATFKNKGENTYGFEVGSYDISQNLIIDPLVIVYSTYIGGKGGEGRTWVAVDTTGAAYLASWAYSNKFPTKNAIYPTFSGEIDAVVIKVSPDGNSLVYSTYLGGSGRDLTVGLTVDSTGAAYVIGVAREGFPAVNTLHEYQGAGDAFIVKVDPSGTSLVYSTYLGGTDFDRARGIAADSDGNAYVTGTTRSHDFPLKKAFQRKNFGNGDNFLTKINPTGSALVFSTLFGGSGAEEGTEVALDARGNIYVTGDTSSKDFPKKKAFQKKIAGGNDAFLTKFDKKGKKLLYSTYLGGTKTEESRGLDVDMWGNVYVIGGTNSPDFPITNALYGTHAGDFDIFLTKFKPNGKKLHFSTYLGGPQADTGQVVIVDLDNTVYIRGYTESKKFPTKDATMKKYQGKGDAVLAQIAENGQSLIFSTFFGGSEWDMTLGLALDYMGGIYLAGGTNSPDIPTKNAYQKNYKGSGDIFLTKFKKE